MSEEWHPPAWMYRNTRPPNDNAYFENMTRIIFQAGLSWKLIDKKWPRFRKAFMNFHIEQVAQFNNDDVEQLMNNPSIVRNRAKILATTNNARQFQNIAKGFGSFQRFIDSLDKSNNYALVVKVLNKRFNRIGPSSARIFLYSVGENIKHSEE
ncbi:MAG: DNA-3-methyladenine glycosylase I [Candidatus Bathyarchaeota archaeon]|nr:DNA-3-methyladenine glycosylase I [Candidatus Bathyarchaeota archaeon]